MEHQIQEEVIKYASIENLEIYTTRTSVLKNKFIITNLKTHLHSSVDKKQKAVHCLCQIRKALASNRKMAAMDTGNRFGNVGFVNFFTYQNRIDLDSEKIVIQDCSRHLES